jgi:hypothetical protein
MTESGLVDPAKAAVGFAALQQSSDRGPQREREDAM